MVKSTVKYDALFIVFLATICHLLFSKYGFNPTDEGFVLSASNRVLHGQIPHVDFSSVRPLGYAYLHITELLFSKNYIFLISRFVFWLEQVLIAYLWIRFLIHYSKKEISLLNKYALIVVCFIFNVHYFPCSVLHTIDGLLMSIIGINLIISERKWYFIGFFFIGFAALCKQNYLIILPFTILLFGRKDYIINIIVGILPIVLYISIISYFGGFNDIKIQLTGHNELLKVGMMTYLLNPFIFIGIFGIFIYKQLKQDKTYVIYFIIVYAVLILSTNHIHGKYGFLFVGILFGDMINRYKNNEVLKVPFIVLLFAWCVSISVGYNSIALFSGGIISWIIFDYFNDDKSYSKVFFTLIFFSIISFLYVRANNIYRDASIKNLNYKLDDIVEGAYGIKTNLNTYKVLVELDLLKKKYPNLIVAPDFTACNILHSHQSKILTEWPNKTEIPNDKILQKVISKIGNDTTLFFAIPKYQTALLKDSLSLFPNDGKDYRILNYINSEKYFFKEKQALYFMLFQNKINND